MIENQKSAVIISWIVLLKAIRVICKSNVTFMSVLQVEKSMISINILSHNFTGLKKLPLLNYFFLLFFISFETKWCLTHKKTENKYWFCYNLFIGHLHRNYLLFFEIIKICDFVEVFGYKNGHSPKIDRVLKYILRNKSLIGFRCFYLFLI
jgi:hypothetical protein